MNKNRKTSPTQKNKLLKDTPTVYTASARKLSLTCKSTLFLT